MRASILARRALGAAALLAFSVWPRVAPSAQPESTATALPVGLPLLCPTDWLGGAPHPWLRHADLSDVCDSLRSFYMRRGNTPCWIENGQPTARARAWIDELARLDGFGVPPVECDVPQLTDSLAAITPDRILPPERVADLDVAVSAATARALRALHSGRLDPALVDSNLILLHRPLAVGVLMDSLVTGSGTQGWLERVQPSFRQYRALLGALERYREALSDSVLMLPAVAPRMRPGRPSAAIANVRRTLELAGDLKWGSARGSVADSLVDPRLTAAIARFQRRHHLPPTGQLDSLGWLELHAAVPERMQQMGRTLEQYRWLPHELSAPLLFVNIPAFRLDAMTRLDQPDSEALHINVVVGTAYKSQTPVLTAALTSVDFAPEWDVPPSIARNEVQVSALEDTTYLGRNHMELIRAMRVLPPTRANIEKIGHGVRVRQLPGPDNPLGGIKFMLPNKYDVYLHDSPARQLFGARTRDFSHGCIRLGNAPALARFALRDRPDWPGARIDSAIAGATTLKVRLPSPMLVAIVYATVEARDDGSVRFYPDVYGHDRALELLLAGASRDTLIAERTRAHDVRHKPPAVPTTPAGQNPPGVPPPIAPPPRPTPLKP